MTEPSPAAGEPGGDGVAARPRLDRGRLRRVLAHIDAHLEEDLSLEALSSVARASRFHFHRRFAASAAMSPHEYVQRLRLCRAAVVLVFAPAVQVVEVALASGYESHEAFTRAFRQRLGQAPSTFRRRPRWDLWHREYDALRRLRSQHMQKAYRPDDVRVVDLPETPVAMVVHRGDPRGIFASVQRLIAYRKANDLPPARHATYNVLYGSPDGPRPDEFRMDLCVASPKPVVANEQGVLAGTIGGGRYAVLRHVGSDDTLGEAVRWLAVDWVRASGGSRREGANVLVERLTLDPRTPPSEALIDIYVPID
ncbi:MAG: AraC family transcriptional regulator [Myxococcales bacterium]|nr:AraC family transcriptional regulator [Myxococcales bacterium]MCB9735119.1 AraC family transcriptional regulator [Deltaproteobacteria bacterium]